jgi:hypothetical protein
MDQTPDQKERHIEETRHRLSDDISELEEKVKSTLDWRAQFKARPGTMLAVAFGGGALLAGLIPPIRSSSTSSESRWNEQDDRDSRDLAVRSANGTASQTSETLGAIKGALVALATAKLSGLIEEFIPGFKREFDAQTGRSANRYGSSASEPTPWQRSGASGSL